MSDRRANDEEFYVGYDGTMPPRMARRIRSTAAVLLGLTVGVAVALVWAQQPFAPSRFEFGTTRTFHGRLTAAPYPTLHVARPGDRTGRVSWSSYLLVGPGKSGARGLSPLDGAPVALAGTLVYRDDETMIEIVPRSLRAEAESQAALLPGPEYEDLGSARLAGEIVDSKCFLGVMNPGHLQVHRDCAVRCIAGGIPPMLIVRRRGALPLCLLLVTASRTPVNAQVLSMIATPVVVSGRVLRRGAQLYLAADPRAYQVLDR